MVLGLRLLQLQKEKNTGSLWSQEEKLVPRFRIHLEKFIHCFCVGESDEGYMGRSFKVGPRLFEEIV